MNLLPLFLSLNDFQKFIFIMKLYYQKSSSSSGFSRKFNFVVLTPHVLCRKFKYLFIKFIFLFITWPAIDDIGNQLCIFLFRSNAYETTCQSGSLLDWGKKTRTYQTYIIHHPIYTWPKILMQFLLFYLLLYTWFITHDLSYMLYYTCFTLLFFLYSATFFCHFV